MPPTFAAAIITISGLYLLKNKSTTGLSSRSNYLSVFNIRLLNPCLSNDLTIEEPNIPLWPATKILLLLFICLLLPIFYFISH